MFVNIGDNTIRIDFPNLAVYTVPQYKAVLLGFALLFPWQTETALRT